MTGDTALSELMSKPLMSVEVKLEAEGTPGRHPDITKPQCLVNKVKRLF
jgi:hypothetical protein